MCGIAGVFDTSGAPVADGLAARMCATIAHRGPDSSGVYERGEIALGHTRLAIIDLSPAGAQPMPNEDGSCVIVFNGEIYNFRPLRAELVAKGHVFRSQTDTEVVLHGYEEWGAGVVERLNGMFAFGIWDERVKRLFLARDRFGVKPLYYASDGSRFVFGSEVKALLEAGAWRGDVDHSALVQYFTFQNIFTDATLFRGVRILPAAHYAFVERGGAAPSLTRYWDLTLSGDGDGLAFEEARAQLREQLEAAVTRQLMSDVPLGSYLSGGMDSGSLVALAGNSIPHLMTFTGGFELSLAKGIEQNFDEREAAEGMARLFRTDHYEMVLHGGSMQRVLPRLIWHLEDLRVGMSYQNWYIAHLASKFVRVVLSGGGGDEMFAGYPWRYLPLLETSSEDAFLDASYRCWQRLIPANERVSFFTASARRASGDVDPFDAFRDVFAPLGGAERWSPVEALDREMYFEAKTFLHGLLVVEDKISSAHALETRVPFLDNDLVDFVSGLPVQYKLDIPGLVGSGEELPGDGQLRTSDGKHILRKAMEGVLPDAILGKKKQGFSTPDESWYRGDSMGYIRDTLLSPRSLERGYVEPAYVQRVLEEHAEGKRNHRLLIWSLLSFEWWNRVFVDGERPEPG